MYVCMGMNDHARRKYMSFHLLLELSVAVCQREKKPDRTHRDLSMCLTGCCSSSGDVTDLGFPPAALPPTKRLGWRNPAHFQFSVNGPHAAPIR